MAQRNLSTEKKIMDLENNLWLLVGAGGSWMDWELGVKRYRLSPLEWIYNEILLFNTGNCLITYDEA